MKKVTVDGLLTSRGFKISVVRGNTKKDFPIIFPKEIWEKYPRILKRSLLDNFAFVSTCHLPFQDNAIRDISYNGFRPENISSYLNNLFYTIPFDAFMASGSSFDLYKALINTRFSFKVGNEKMAVKINDEKPLRADRAVIPFTFGKDSLLTYALTKELGIKSRLVFIVEPRELYAATHKREMVLQFSCEFNQPVYFLPNSSGVLRDASAGTGWFGWELLLTTFTLLLLPFAYKDRSKYLFFANEASCNELTHNGEAINFYPVYEQTDEWTKEESLIAGNVTGMNFQAGSLIGSIHELAIIKILHSRYPEIGKYQMSCFADRPEAKHKRWCASCSKCARNYIFLLANGVKPETVGFSDDMLKDEFSNLYSIFESENGKEGFDATDLGREEQLLAFLLAYERGINGELIDKFKVQYLEEAKKKKRILMDKYYGVNQTTVLPEEYKSKIVSIFKRELKR